MKRINTVDFGPIKSCQYKNISTDYIKSIDKSAEMDYLWKANITFAESMGTVFSGKSLWHSNNTMESNNLEKERKTNNSNDMKIINSKLIKTQERGSLTIWNILSFSKRKEMFIYEFEVEVNTSTLHIGDNLLGANYLKLLVINKLSETNFVLRTKELHPCPPFMGIDLIVVSRSFSKGSVKNELFCEKWKNENIPFATEEFTWIKIKELDKPE